MVIVRVGEEATPFHVHKGLLSFHSLYFRNNLSGRWGDGKDIELKDQDPDDFSRFFSFLYTGRLWESTLPDTEHNQQSSPRLVTSPAENDIESLTRLYVFGDFHQAPRFKNAVMDAMVLRLSRDFVIKECTAWLEYAYANSPEGSGLRKFIVDLFSLTSGNFIEHLKLAKGKAQLLDFFSDVAIATHPFRLNRNMKLRDASAWAACNKCDYHDHNDINVPEKAVKEVS